MIGRRELLAAGAVGAALLAAPAAQACTLTGEVRRKFSDRACRAALEEWVELLNQGPQMSADAIAERVDDLNITIDDDMVGEALAETANTETGRDTRFYKEFRLSGGRLDTRPIRIDGINLIRQLKSRATYQFTLERYSYHPADPEGCNGLFTHDEYWGVERDSYLATFWNNRLRTIRPFPEWYLEERA